MRFDDHHDISDPLPQYAAGFRPRAVFNAAFLLLGMAVLGALGIYIANTLPYVNFASRDRAYWLIQTCVFVGYGMLALSAIAGCRAAERLTRRTPLLALGWRVAMGGIAMAAATGLALVFLVFPMFFFFTGIAWHYSLPMWVLTSMLALALYAALLVHRARVAECAQALQVQLDTDAMEATLDQAELSLLEAQIEPHFLFNTLAHIKRYDRIDPTAAGKMIAALSDYLDQAAPALRRADWTVGDELTLIQAYFDIIADRFGTHIQFAVTASEESRRVRVPALMVATLVDNAVRHGVVPQVEGGTIWITAEVDSAALRIEVRDDGVGLNEGGSSGLGIPTVRARLRNAFGARAVFTVEQAAKGVRASITIPLEA